MESTDEMMQDLVVNSIAEVEAYLATTEGRSISDLTPAEVDEHCRTSYEHHFSNVVEDYGLPIKQLHDLDQQVYLVYQHHFHVFMMRAVANLRKFSTEWE